MPLIPIKSVVSKAQNGVGAFVLQCKRIDFHYCDWAGSSRGMNLFLKYHLASFAKENPQIEVRVSPRPNKHPIMRGYYINGREKAICVRNMEKEQVLAKANLLKEASGEKPKRVRKPVSSINESVRGIWSPYHGSIKDV
ncbi:39S ribosomal protein L51, mitochondrial [Ascosphaera aggregata]|nr:39S ribosomal protein L51, mitochondrial [Ascosphaera aggregata]